MIAAITGMLSELITCWPRFRAEASDEDQRHVMLVRTHLHQLLDLCLTVSEELHQIASSRGAAARRALHPPEFDESPPGAHHIL